jgi:8-oxo-dGTP pyrophosphatase MutT (NUDIX family)
VSVQPEIRPAATVIVLRDAADGPEVFMVRRHHAIAFMAGAHVFPGGRVDESDRSADASWCDAVPAAREKLPGVAPDDALAFQVAAARELFEEAGVLLARHADGNYVSLAPAADRERFSTQRAALNAGRATLQQIVTDENLRLALDALVHYAHWVTPPADVRRFDTRFFVTRVPPHQTPVHDDHETTDSVWIRPAGAIVAAGRGEIMLPPPTWATLRELERFVSVDAALAWSRARPIHRREPKVIIDNGVRRVILPGDVLFPDPHPMPFETRFVLTDGRWSPEAGA